MIYNICMLALRTAVTITAVFSGKIRLMNNAYKNIIPNTEAAINKIKQDKPLAKTTWIHCASLGEFEQARPLIEQIKFLQKNSIIIVTFFSPSGYEIRKNYEYADAVFYLPIDTPNNAKLFVQAIKPDNVVIVKYEFWRNMLRNVKKQGANLILISAPFRKSMPFFKPWGKMWREMLQLFDQIYVQNYESKQLLATINICDNVFVAGDTRFDRVENVTRTAQRIETIEQFADGKKMMIAGSTWQEDIDVIIPLIVDSVKTGKQWKFIVAPHEINQAEIDEIIKKMPQVKVARYSQTQNTDVRNVDLLIVDCIGILTSIYQYGTIAYVGGAFKTGLHNILEPAAWGMPVIFGPIYNKFIEAQELIELGGAKTVRNNEELNMAVLDFEQNIDEVAQIAANYVKSKCGATKIIIDNAPKLTN